LRGLFRIFTNVNHCIAQVFSFDKIQVMETVLITGGTGLIGRALTKMLTSANYRVIVATRSPRKDDAAVSYVQWDPAKHYMDHTGIGAADHIIHLAGAGVADKRWTKKRKQEIRDSRVDGSATLVKALQQISNKVKSVVSASGIGWYGPDKKGHGPFREGEPAYDDFLGKTCVEWEQSIQPVVELGKRLIILRTGIVLSNDGGAYVEFKKPLKGGIAAILGSGRQKVSWIHIDDICRAYLYAIKSPNMNGVYNATAPEVVTNKEMVLQIARMRKRPYLAAHVPEFVLKVMLGEMSIEVLKSAAVDDTKLRNAGFQFAYPTIDAAVGELEKGE
jgi:uncharacterized protein (TIGR01777 family)